MKYLLNMFEGIHAREIFFFSGYALYLVFSHMTLTSATTLSSAGELEYSMQTMFSIAVIGTRIITFVVLLVCMPLFRKISFTALAIVTGALALMGFLVLAMVLQFAAVISSVYDFLPWLAFGGVLIGFSGAAAILLWARFSATLPLRLLYFYIVLCHAASLVIYFVITFLPQITGLPIAAAMFIASIVLVKKSLDSRPEQQWEYSRPMFKKTLRKVSHPIFGTAILYFMSGLMLQISGQHEIPLTTFQNTSLYSSAVVVILLLIPALVIKRPPKMGQVYSITLPVAAAGFLLLPLIWNAAGGIVNAFVQLGAMVAGIILWCLLANISRETRLSPFLLFPIALSITDAADLIGEVIGMLHVDTIAQSDIALTTVALVAVYLLLMAALFIFKDKSFTKLEAESHEKALAIAVQPETVVAARCDEIADLHRLTSREGDVFILLAQGFTVPVISEKLYVSENTVKSHVKNIYQKLGISARSDLIELVNDGEYYGSGGWQIERKVLG
jgi:DNA-binding NarL/FixJ family response regulator